MKPLSPSPGREVNQPVTFFVPGHPKTAGSKKTVTYQRRDGSMGTRVIDNCAGGANWRHMVTIIAKPLFPRPLTGPLSLSLTFYLERPKTHSCQSGLRSSAREYHIIRPDLTKLIRAAEDALTGIAWKDDAQIVFQLARKTYAGLPGPGVSVVIDPIVPSAQSPNEETR